MMNREAQPRNTQNPYFFYNRAMTEAELKIQLHEIIRQDYEVVKVRAQQLLPEMVEHIGNPNSELRGTLIYSTLTTCISRNVFDLSELRTLLHAYSQL
jgi:hypothetical protein